MKTIDRTEWLKLYYEEVYHHLETPSFTPPSPLDQLTHICPIGTLGNVYPSVVLMQIGFEAAATGIMTSPRGGPTIQ